MDFSVVVPTYNRSRILVKTLEALLGPGAGKRFLPFSYEIIVVDDGSTDDTETRIEDPPKPAAVRQAGSQAAVRCTTFVNQTESREQPATSAQDRRKATSWSSSVTTRFPILGFWPRTQRARRSGNNGLATPISS